MPIRCNRRALHRPVLDVGRSKRPFLAVLPTQLEGPLRAFVLEKGEAFIVGRTDWEYLTTASPWLPRRLPSSSRAWHWPHAGAGQCVDDADRRRHVRHGHLVDELQGIRGCWCRTASSRRCGRGERNVGRCASAPVASTAAPRPAWGGSGAAGGQWLGGVPELPLHLAAPATRRPSPILARHGTLSLQGCES